MRQIPEEMAARIESGAAGLCHVWLLKRADGVKMGFTDHDADLAVEGVRCRVSSGWTAGAAESAVGLGAGSASVAGGLDDAAVTEADVAAGLYDRARVELWRVDWAKPELRGRLVHAVSGVAARPWTPVHLSVETEDEGRRIRWRARSRIDGDRWDGEAAGADPLRFRVRVMDGAAVLRDVEVEGLDWLYPAADLAADFGGGPGAEAVVGVSQWGEGYGWGAEATAALS